MDREYLSLDAEQLAKHAVVQAYESRNEYCYIGVDDEVNDWSLYDAHKNIVEVAQTDTESRHGPSFEVDNALTGVRVHCEQTGYVSEKTARATHLEPASYKNHDVTIYTTAWWFPQPDQLAPLTAIEVDQEGGRPTPPDPEPRRF